MYPRLNLSVGAYIQGSGSAGKRIFMSGSL